MTCLDIGLSSTCAEWENKKIGIKNGMCVLIRYPKEWKKVYYSVLKKIRQLLTQLSDF